LSLSSIIDWLGGAKDGVMAQGEPVGDHQTVVVHL